MVALLTTPKRQSQRVQEICSELELTLKQRKQIKNPRVRHLLNNRILDLQAELIVFGWP
ncbi:MAG: hypothetical protein SH850_22430 [Planctomycetaceae bacterium]|nr:hypothetical protein [Planctomycetaceae bacterium]